MQECFTDVILSSITFSIFLRFNIKKIEKVIFRRFFIELIGLEKSVVIHTVSNEIISEIVVFKCNHKFGCIWWNRQPKDILTRGIEIKQQKIAEFCFTIIIFAVQNMDKYYWLNSFSSTQPSYRFWEYVIYCNQTILCVFIVYFDDSFHFLSLRSEFIIFRTQWSMLQ